MQPKKLAGKLQNIVEDAQKNIASKLSQVDLQSLPSVFIDTMGACDELPARTSVIYFLHHPVYRLLYVGKAKDLRKRWRSLGGNGYVRMPAHQHMMRCLEISERISSLA